MTLNAILSTSKEEMIQDPTIVKFTPPTNNSEDLKIKTDHELKKDKEEIQIFSNKETIESSAKIRATKCHLCDTRLTNIPSLDKHMKSTHKAENVIAKDTSTIKNFPCDKCNISPPDKGSPKTYEECPEVTETKIKTEIFKHETKDDTESTREVINKEQEKLFNGEGSLPNVETLQKINLLTNKAKIKTEISKHETEDDIDSTKAVAKTKNHETKNNLSSKNSRAEIQLQFLCILSHPNGSQTKWWGC